MVVKGKAVRAAFIIPLFFVLNAALSMLNRWALGTQGFRFPLILTSVHAISTILFMLPALLSSPALLHSYRRNLSKEWRGILLVGACLAINIALNNCSLEYISLSLNQVVRASIPLVTAVFTAATERKLPRRSEFIGLVVLCSGVSAAIGEASASGDIFGITMCLLSVIAGAATLTATAKVLAGRIDSVQLTFLTAPVTCMFLLPPAAVLERDGISQYLIERPSTAGYILVVSSILAGMYNVVHNDLVAITDPVTTCVLGQIKIVALMGLSAYFLGEGRDWTLRMSVGSSAAILGFSIYSWAKIRGANVKSGAAKGGNRTTPNGKKTPVRGLRVIVTSPTGDARTPPPTLPGLRTPSSRATALTTNRSSLVSRTPRTTRGGRHTPGSMV